MEIAIIVNEDDEIIDHKDRSTIQKEDIYRVSTLLIKNSKGEFLLAQRGFNKKNNPGVWSFSVSGGVAEGEDYDSTIIRETQEEIGVTDLEMLKIFKVRVKGGFNFHTQFYVAKMDVVIGHFTRQIEEVEKLRWFSIDEIRQGSFKGYPFSKTLMKYLDKFNGM